MPFWTGIAGKAREIIAPYFGVGGKARRVMNGYVGVNGKARLFYTYLDDIDHIEAEFTSVSVYTNITSSGGTLVCTGKTACANNERATVSISGNTVTIELNGTAAERTFYAYFQYWIVLKGGYKVRLDYAKTNDNKTITAVISWSDFYTSRTSWYYYLYYWLLGDDDCPIESVSQNASGTDTVTLSSGYSGGMREKSYYANQVMRHKITFGTVTIGGKAFSVTVVDNIAA